MRTSLLLLAGALLAACSGPAPMPAPTTPPPVSYDDAQTALLRDAVSRGVLNREDIAYLLRTQDEAPVDERAADDAHALRVRQLVEAGADPNVQTEDHGQTALMYAAFRDDAALAEALLAAGADPNLSDRYGYAALSIAEDFMYHDLAELLIARGADPERFVQNAILRTAMILDKPENAITALQQGADPNTARRVDVNEYGYGFWGYEPALSWALQRRHLDLARLLLRNGADPNRPYGYSPPLLLAATTGDAELVALMIELGADVQADSEGGWTALHEAAVSDHAAIVQILLANGAGVDAAAHTGQTPLYRAAYFNNLEAARVLLEAGANVHARTVEGETPLSVAEARGHETMVQLLMQYDSE